MKQYLRTLLTCALILAMTLSFALPAFAEDNEPNPAVPVITVQPQGSSQKDSRATFSLSVGAHIPNGDAIGYAWYRDGALIPENETSAAAIRLTTPGTASIYVVVYNLEHPERSVTSETVQIELRALSFWDKVRTTLSDISGAAGEVLQIPLKILAFPFVALIELLMLAAIVVLPLMAAPFLWISKLFK